jgi:hypothetical protein
VAAERVVLNEFADDFPCLFAVHAPEDTTGGPGGKRRSK